VSELLNKTPQEAAADLAATNNLRKALIDAFKSMLAGFRSGVKIGKKKSLTVAANQQQIEHTQATLEIDRRAKSSGVSKAPNVVERGTIYGPGINKLTAADCQAIAAIVTATKGATIGGSDYDYTIRHNGQILFETKLGEVTTHTRLPEELHRQLVNLTPGPRAVDAPSRSNAAVASPVSEESSNFAAQIKDVAILRGRGCANERGDFLDPAEVKNYKNIFRQVKRGIVPESTREAHQQERDLARSQVLPTATTDKSQAAEREPSEEITTVPDRGQQSPVSPEAQTAPPESSVSIDRDRQLKIIRSLFNIFGRNTNKENHNTERGREGILELPTGAKLVNKIDNGIAYLSLISADVVHQLGSYDSATNEFAIDTGLANITVELADLKPYLDPKTLTIVPDRQHLEKPTIAAPTASGREDRSNIIDRKTPIQRPLKKPVIKQSNLDPDLTTDINIEAEENLMAKILTVDNALDRASRWGVSDRSFFITQYQQIFQVARAIADRGEAVNLLSVGEAMRDLHPQIDSSLVTILSRDNPAASLDSVANIVRAKQLARELAQVATRLKADVYDRGKPLFQITREHLGAIAAIDTGSYELELPTSIAPLEIVNLSNLQSERQLIATIVQVPQAVKYLSEIGVSDECFTHPEHRAIYVAVRDLDRAAEEVNLLSVRNRLDRSAATTASDIVESTLLLPVALYASRAIESRQRQELLVVSNELTAAASAPHHLTKDLVEVLATAKTAIERTAAKSLKLPDLQIEESQPEPEPDLNVNLSQGR
jgi:DnaB-like helicase N terminal domain